MKTLIEILAAVFMVAGGFLFFIGALGAINPGFKDEIPGGPAFVLIGLTLMIGAVVLSCQASEDISADKGDPEMEKIRLAKEKAERNKRAIKQFIFFLAIFIAAAPIGFIFTPGTTTKEKTIAVIALLILVLGLGIAYKLFKKTPKADMTPTPEKQPEEDRLQK